MYVLFIDLVVERKLKDYVVNNFNFDILKINLIIEKRFLFIKINLLWFIDLFLI